MAKSKTLPEGVDKSNVQLITYDKPTDTTKLYTKDNKVYTNGPDSNGWKETTPGNVTKLPAEEGKTAATVTDTTVDPFAAERAELQKQVEALKAENDTLKKGQRRGPFEGRSPPKTGDVATASAKPMAGKYPHNTDDMPTVDDINKSN